MNYYVQEFVGDVLSLVSDNKTKEEILNGKMSIGNFLEKNAKKGIDPQLVLKCLELRDLDYLNSLACKQNRIDAYYSDWLECFILKHGPTYIQNKINEELEQDNIQFIDDAGKEYFVTKRLLLIKK